MDVMQDAIIHLRDLEEMTDQELIGAYLREDRPLRLDFPLDSLGSTSDPGDIASDYMDASYFGERLAPLCSSIHTDTVHGKVFSVVRFTMTPADVPKFLAELRRITPGFAFDDEPDMAIRDEVADFEDHIFEAKLRLPDLADKYMANFLSGTSYTENAEYWKNRLPILRLGFWRSFASDLTGCEFYTSSRWDGMWIVIGDRAATQRLLALEGGYTPEGSQLCDAMSLRLNDFPHVAVTPGAVIEVPPTRLDKAITCLRRYIAPALAACRPSDRAQWERFVEKPRIEWDRWYGFSWAMTEDGDVLVCGDRHVNVVSFDQRSHRYRPESVLQFLAANEHATDVFRKHLGLDTAPLSWASLVPEKFEELCYDVLLRSGRFDERTFRKHGKTKSRDGGRDIEAWTLPRVNEPSEKWIFQCKFITNGSALSGSRVVISDVIDQYSAKGFGVMTNEVIDSTLYDKLDQITTSRNIGRDSWDGARIQRFLAGRPDLWRRHFANDPKDVSPL